MIEGHKQAPFPIEILNNTQSLENYFLSFPDGDNPSPPSFEDFPSQFTSGGIEQYANWLTLLTQQDPKHYERGAFIHLRTKPTRKLVYPSNPYAGRAGVSPPFAFQKPFVLPIICIHSHDLAFSPCDLRTSIEGAWENGRFVHPIASVLATPKDNLLLFRTKQTDLVAKAKPFHELEIADIIPTNEGEKMRGAAEKMNISIREVIFFTFFAQDLEFSSKTLALLYNQWVAERYNLKFYHSARSGVYTAATGESLHAGMSDKIKTGVEEAIKKDQQGGFLGSPHFTKNETV